MKKIILTILVVILLTVYYTGHLEYYYNKLILSNQSTRLFSCNEFKNKEDLQKILANEIEKKSELINYLKEINGNIQIRKVERCNNKYEFLVTFQSDQERIEILKIIPDQKLQNVPVFLQNV